MFRKKGQKMFAGLAFGALIGFSGLLLAPRKGQESRQFLKDRMGRLKARVKRNHRVNHQELPEVLASRDADYLH